MNTIDDKQSSSDNSNKNKKVRTGKKMKKDNLDPKAQPICNPIIPPDLSEQDIHQLEELTKHVNAKIDEVIRKEVEHKTRKNPDLDQLKSMVGEFCDTYMVIGYTLNGEPFVIYNAKNAQSHNALAEHLRLTFMNIYKPPLF